MAKYQELRAEELCFTCCEDLLEFTTTEEVTPLEVMIGQERAVKAVEFGLFTKNPEYNIFMSGLVGTGKITYAKSAVGKVAATEAVPLDWCYVNNFNNPGQPIAISLKAGMGRTLCQDMQELVENLRTGISKVFSSEDYEKAKTEVVKGFQVQRAVLIDSFNDSITQMGIVPQWTTTGFVGIPVINDKPVTPEEFQKLDKDEREAIEKKLLAAHESSAEVIRKIQNIEREVREQLKGLDTKIGLYAVGHLIEELQEKYNDYQQVVDYLETVKQDVVKNINDFKPQTEDEQNPLAFFKKNTQESIKDKYKINLLVDHHDTKGAPVVVEINPTYHNLIGLMEYQTRMGVATTDFSMIKAGALHKANGGYLILNARDVLTNIGSWEALKRVLKTRSLTIENLAEHYGMVALSSLKPQPIPIDVKVILIGSPYLYHLMYNYDEDFRKLFKIHADFDVEMKNNPININKLAQFISSTVVREKLKPFDRSAVARIVEYSCRLAGSQQKLTTRFNEVVELLCEADSWAKLANSDIIQAEHIIKAIREKRYRSNKYEERLQEMFAEGKLLIDTDGAKIGQINGLAVMSVGEYMFGKPSRITANTYLGKSGVINIERETKMSGTSHTKGVLTLSSYIGLKYAQNHPLTLTASLTFEQLYDGVDGDSASSTELYALLSSLAEVPIKQSIAVTGSVNQKGEVQPIGGATQKIEGFFAVCKIKGLTGDQGVMIPYQNIDDLTLNDEVVQAVKDGQFHIYPVKTIDEGIEILTGVPAGNRDETAGTYPTGTIHYLVAQKLKRYMQTIIKLGKHSEEDKDDKEDKKE